ncbi:hypothetical protein [Hansschlegelia zhihuaiae]|uniref:Uncharacterized protein n=1 Tax=Hansschlegelia zhihuaiae TaxID=405005 RepID=A0A4Q0MF36_9HYPH|nr:hypothetical protein [Hansschlegelia zhihuaiae]RXF72080.1 hypothetical protein EK403_14815 [Hansschlegelia zhihuaiae]
MTAVALRSPVPGPLDDAWDEFRRKVLPDDAPVARQCEARWAFYAGAASFYRLASAPLFPSDDVKPSDLKVLRRLDAEIEQFSYDVHIGLATSRATGFFGGFRAAVYGEERG